MSAGLPNYTNPRRGFSVFSFVLGIIVGGGIASAILGFLLIDQQTRHAEELQAAAVRLGVKGIDAFGNMIETKTTDRKVTSEEDKIAEIGKAFVDDLEKNRLFKLHRTLTEEYRTKNPMDMFQAQMDKFPAIRQLDSYNREYLPPRKLGKDRGYEYYFTGRDRNTAEIVNVAMILKNVEGEWLIDDLQLSQPQRK